MRVAVFFLFLIFSFQANSQKKEIDHEVYNDWKTLKSELISNNGTHVAYQIKPHRGDGMLHLYRKETEQFSIKRGKKPVFSNEGNFLFFLIDPGFDTLRQLELEKVEKEKWIKDTLGIYNLETNNLVTFDNIKSFKKAKENSSWIAFAQPIEKEEKEVKKKKWWQIFKKKDQSKEIPESKGNLLTIYNPKTEEKHTVENVVNYDFDRKGNYLIYTTHQKIDKKDSVHLHVFNTKEQSFKSVENSFSAVGDYNFDFQGTQIAFLASKDTVKENKLFFLYTWDFANKPVVKIDTNRSDLPEGLMVSEFGKPSFSRNGKSLFFGLKELPTQEPEDTLLDSEKAKLDVWHHADNKLQPQQLKQKKREEKNTFLSVIHFSDDKIIQLEDDTLSVRLYDFKNSPYGLGISRERYESTYNWSYPWAADYYRVNIKTGEKQLVKENLGYALGLSPTGKYFVYFDSKENHYKYFDFKNEIEQCLTCFLKDTTIVWTNDVNGMPHDPRPIGVVGFTKNDETMILHSEYDIWQADLNSNVLTSLTDYRGFNSNTTLRLKKWENDSTFIDLNKVYIHGVEKSSKDEIIYELELVQKGPVLTPLIITPHKITTIKKAKNSNDVIYRKMNVTDYPDLYLTTTTFENEVKISDANPQQSDYRWPTVEKIEWTSPLGKELEGLIYKPEDFDSTKSYPMIVYFYELYGDRKHVHYIPKPTASIIYATEYTSAEYVVFIPDIRYDPGYPARGAYDCIMSGTNEVLKMYPNIDSTRMGLQGQSWGGYQTAQLITMTNRYKAAMAGAPVSNMFSAYGGIRWGSGLNRQFQYEKSQSRIGKTIWEAPELYVENSPIFGIPEIETPLLIMHNDNDGAVPWYQGIEMFVGMKRLGKPVWMLNYNGDEHNLMKNANRMDLSIRMRQFFDYYLQDRPAPEWLIQGVPAVKKGKEYRLELIEE